MWRSDWSGDGVGGVCVAHLRPLLRAGVVGVSWGCGGGCFMSGGEWRRLAAVHSPGGFWSADCVSVSARVRWVVGRRKGTLKSEVVESMFSMGGELTKRVLGGVCLRMCKVIGSVRRGRWISMEMA